MKTKFFNAVCKTRYLALLIVLILTCGNAWGTDWSYTFSSTPAWTGSGTSRTMTINSATWSVSTSNSSGSPSTWGSYGNNYGSGGIKFGDSKTNYYGAITLSTDYFSSSLVSEVTVNLLINGSVPTTITVTQGSTIGSPSYNTGNQWHDFTANTNIGTSGTLTLTITTAQAIFIHSIAVTYTAATPRTVTFNKQGGTFDDPAFDSDNTLTEASGGAGVTLPLVNPSSACAPEGWGFYGWATSPVTSSTTTAPTIVGKAGETYHPTSNITLHAVFAQGEYTKETSAITSGAKYLIVANSTKNYVMTDSYSLNSDTRGEMASAQIDETTSGKYSAASVNAQWCYTIEASSTLYYIRDVKNSGTNNYVDIAFLDWYGQPEDVDDKYTLTLSAGKWTIENDYSYFYFNSTNHVFTNNPSSSTQFLLYKAGTINYYSTPSCCDKDVTLAHNSPSNGTVTFSPAGPIATCSETASDRQATMTITPNTGYYLSAFNWSTGAGTITPGVSPAISTSSATGAQAITLSYNQDVNGTSTFNATFTAKDVTDWTWKQENPGPEEITIPATVNLYVGQQAWFNLKEYTPSDVINEKKGYSATYSSTYLAQVGKGNTQYKTRAKAVIASTTLTFTSTSNGSVTQEITISISALPSVTFIDLIHGESFSAVSANVDDSDNRIVHTTKPTPTHSDVADPGEGYNACERNHLHLVGWIDKAWVDDGHQQATHSEISSAGSGNFYAPGADMDLVAKNGKTFYAVWAKEGE